MSPSEWKVKNGIIYRDKHCFCKGQGVMATTISGATAKHKPRGKSNSGMALGREGPLSQTSNINNMRIFNWQGH